MKKFVFFFVIIAVCVAPAIADNGDTRHFVKMPDPMQQHMLSNMRDHLLAITEIQQALSSGAFDNAASIAEKRLGISSLISHNASHMAPYMPKEMQEIGTQMHKAASQFALIAEETAVDGDVKRSIGALSKITQQCVACHTGYRAH